MLPLPGACQSLGFRRHRYAPFNLSENEALHAIKRTPWLGSENMANVTYEREFTALLVIDPYNDFISEGGKIWDRIKNVAEANNCVPHMFEVLNAARKAGLRIFYALHHRYRPGDYRRGNTLRLSRGQPGRARCSKAARGVVRSVLNSRPDPARLWPRSIGVPVGLPILTSISCSKSTASTSSSSSG